MNQDIQDLKHLKEFYEQYRHTDQTYINLVKQKENYKQQLYNINKVIADNKKFGWWLLVIGIVTIPIFIGIILIPVIPVMALRYFPKIKCTVKNS